MRAICSPVISGCTPVAFFELTPVNKDVWMFFCLGSFFRSFHCLLAFCAAILYDFVKDIYDMV